MPKSALKLYSPHTKAGKLFNSLNVTDLKICKQLTRDITEISRERLDKRKSIVEQKDVFDALAHEFRNRFPHLFEGRKNAASLKYAIDYVKQRHATLRATRNKGTTPESPRPTPQTAPPPSNPRNTQPDRTRHKPSLDRPPMSHTRAGRLMFSLNLQNNLEIFRSLTNSIRGLAQEYVNYRKSTREEAHVYERVAQRIRKEYPDLFAGEENGIALKNAINYLKHLHSNTYKSPQVLNKRREGRRKQKLTIREVSRRAQSLVPISLNRHPEPPRASLQDRMLRNLAEISSQPATTKMFAPSPSYLSKSRTQRSQLSASGSHISPLTISLLPAESARRIEPYYEPTFFSQQLTPTHHSAVQFVHSTYPVTSNFPNLNSQKPHHPDSIVTIYQFLNGCVPSMTHLLKQFLDFGCTSEEVLWAISTWSRQGVEDFLDRLPPGPSGNSMSQMEKLILLNHFSSYCQS